MEEYPEFYRIIKQKCYTFYQNQIYQPLMKLKNEDIEFFLRRKDYQQVLAIINQNGNEMKSCMFQIFREADETDEKCGNNIIDQSKIWWLIKIVELKFQIFLEISFEMLSRNEYLQMVLWNRIIEAYVKGNVPDML